MRLCSGLFCARLLLSLAVSTFSLAARTETPTAPQAVLARIPLTFEENLGQFESSSRYLARANGYTARVTTQGIDFLLPGQSNGDGAVASNTLGRTQLRFVNAAKTPRITPIDE